MWFSVWLPLVLQLAVPLGLLTWLTFSRPTTKWRLGLRTVFVALYLSAIVIAGLCLVVPWWMPVLYGLLTAAALVSSLRRATYDGPRRRHRQLTGTVLLGACACAAVVVVVAWRGRQPPSPLVDLAFPLKNGHYLVVNGGRGVLINAHNATLEGERFRPYRGQSYGVDIVRISQWGLRADGVLPDDPAAYAIFGDAVAAPCSGRVIAAEDGAPDMSPPTPDRRHMAGNHVIIACGSAWVVLGHLRQQSLRVRAGSMVEIGSPIGVVGNSGNSNEPHLHIHAQRPAPPDAPLSGEPLPIRLGGRFLLRNDRVRTQ